MICKYCKGAMQPLGGEDYCERCDHYEGPDCECAFCTGEETAPVVIAATMAVPVEVTIRQVPQCCLGGSVFAEWNSHEQSVHVCDKAAMQSVRLTRAMLIELDVFVKMCREDDEVEVAARRKSTDEQADAMAARLNPGTGTSDSPKEVSQNR